MKTILAVLLSLVSSLAGAATLADLPGHAAMVERVRSLDRSVAAVTNLAVVGPRVFAVKGTTLSWRETLAAPDKRLLEGNFAWAVPAPDGRHVAVGLVTAGGVVLRVVTVKGARLLPVEIDGIVRDAPPTWHADGRALYYQRATGDGAPRVYRHVLGRASDRDEIVFAGGVGGALGIGPRHLAQVVVPLESRYAIAVAHERDERILTLHVAEQRELAAGRPRWRRVATPADEVLAIAAWKDDIYLVSKRNAPRHRVLRMKAGDGLASARVAVPEGDSIIRAVGIARDALYLHTMVGGADRLERVALGLLGPKTPEYVRIPFDHAIVEMATHPRVEGALLRLEGWVEAPKVMHVDRHGDARRTTLTPATSLDLGDLDEVRLYAPSGEVKIPVTLVYRKSTRLTGTNPVLLLVHGSGGAPYPITFDARRLAWIERGGIVAVAHVRGGGENGEAWAQAGSGADRDNAVRDLIAVADFIASYGFTQPKRLALQGTEAGTALVLAAAARKPGLAAAAVLPAGVTAPEPAPLPLFALRGGADELAETYSFLLWQMGEPGFQPPPPPPPPPPPAPPPAPVAPPVEPASAAVAK